MSGGLDSMLAARLLMEQGIEVVGISFTTPFFGSANAEKASQVIGFPLLIRDITGIHLEVVKDPATGYGANMNPCIDCHALMVKEARKIMDEKGWDFIFTGEVLNERPMSQTRASLNRVANLAGCRGLVLRPLSALRLEETIPEREGKVDRKRLLDIQGRSRKPQMALAEKYGIRDYPAPAGGCLLTDPGFSRRLRDLIDNGPEDGTSSYEMLKTGRHFRIAPGIKAVVGRNHAENLSLEALRQPADLLLRTADIPGPTLLLAGAASEEEIAVAASLVARYCKAGGEAVRVDIESGGQSRTVDAFPACEEELRALQL
jgi:tRNA U34 2-thiouridine synthase MnmA/TrmU